MNNYPTIESIEETIDFLVAQGKVAFVSVRDGGQSIFTARGVTFSRAYTDDGEESGFIILAIEDRQIELSLMQWLISEATIRFFGEEKTVEILLREPQSEIVVEEV